VTWPLLGDAVKRSNLRQERGNGGAVLYFECVVYCRDHFVYADDFVDRRDLKGPRELGRLCNIFYSVS
jgi:hypothetical protein